VINTPRYDPRLQGNRHATVRDIIADRVTLKTMVGTDIIINIISRQNVTKNASDRTQAKKPATPFLGKQLFRILVYRKFAIFP
jgi:ribosomal protein L6P/L9E